MALITVTGGAFSDSAGNVLANGYLLCYLSHDEKNTSAPSQVAAGLPVRINLDNNGNAVTGSQLYDCNAMLPLGSFYTVEAYTNDGRRAWSYPQYVTVIGPSPFSLSSFSPTNPPSTGGGSGSQPLLLENNGTANLSQALLNVESTGNTITITNPSGGNINFEVTNPASSPSASFMFGPGFVTAPYASYSGVFPSADSANQVIVTQFGWPYSATFDKISFAGVTGGANEYIAIGLYSLAGNRLTSSGPIHISSTGVYTGISITSVTLTPGTYYFAWASNVGGAGPQVFGYSIPASLESGNNNLFCNGFNIMGQAANAATLTGGGGGDLPATLGTVTGNTAATNNFGWGAVTFYL